MRSRRSRVERDRRGGVMWSVRPTGPVSSYVRQRVDCPHRQPRKNTLLHRMVVSTSSPMEFVASRGLTARLTSKGIGGQGRARRGGCAQPWCDEPPGRYGGWGQLQPQTDNSRLSFIYHPRCDPAMMRCKPKFGSYKPKFGSNDPNFGSNDPNFGLKCDATEPSRVRVRLRMLGAHRLGQLH